MTIANVLMAILIDAIMIILVSEHGSYVAVLFSVRKLKCQLTYISIFAYAREK